ncbi:MAG: CAP domain-containing protein [Pseudomonadota bacterium]
MSGVAAAREPPPVSSLPAAQLQAEILGLVNQARTQGRTCGGTPFAPSSPLLLSNELYRAARRHARDMAMRNYFAHQGRDGSSPKDRVQHEGYKLRLTGENIAFGPDSIAEVVDGWLASPGHCANIMDPRFRDMGVAVALGSKRGHFYWVQELGEPAP